MLKRLKKALTLQDAFYIAMIAWITLSVLAILYDLIVAGVRLMHGDYNVTIPIHVGLTLPVS